MQCIGGSAISINRNYRSRSIGIPGARLVYIQLPSDRRRCLGDATPVKMFFCLHRRPSRAKQNNNTNRRYFPIHTNFAIRFHRRAVWIIGFVTFAGDGIATELIFIWTRLGGTPLHTRVSHVIFLAEHVTATGLTLEAASYSTFRLIGPI